MIRKHLKFVLLPALAMMAFVGLTSFQEETTVDTVEPPATKYVCIVSSTAANNTGKCRALSSGNGDMCFTSGTGTACSSTGSSAPPPPPPVLP